MKWLSPSGAGWGWGFEVLAGKAVSWAGEGSQRGGSCNSNFSSLLRALLHQDDAFLSEASSFPYHLLSCGLCIF